MAGGNFYAPLDAQDCHAVANNIADQAQLAYRQGEWMARDNLYALLDAQERHATANTAARTSLP